jgi:beta-glucosidase
MRYSEASQRSVPDLIERGWIGSILSETDPERLNAAQERALRSRLGIPLLVGTDAIHGVAMHRGASVFPAPIGLVATWDPELVERCARATAREMRALNLHWTFSPNVDVLRDGRWGRSGECLAEDPFLVAEMGVAMVRGYQGDLSDPRTHVLACAKHYIAGGEPANGGTRAGDEVILVYLRDMYSSVTTPVKQLVAFKRVHVEPGQEHTISLTIQADQLALYDIDMERVIEPGEFEIYVGDQKASFEVIV